MIRKSIIVLTFIIGLSIFLYPIVSHWVKTKQHYTIISKHNEVLQQMTEEQKAKELAKAKQYNAGLNESSIPIEDPFAEGVINTSNNGYYNVLNLGEVMGNLEIPKINVNLPIYHGVGEDVLQQGVGHMSNTSLPIGGDGSHSALTAHRGLPSTKLFRDLDKVNEGDIFLIHMLDETLAYKVEDVQIVLPSETSWLTVEEDKDYVTLITCEPYMINTHRLLVRGERIPYEQETKTAESAKEVTPIKGNVINESPKKGIIPISALVLVVSIFLIVFIKRSVKE